MVSGLAVISLWAYVEIQHGVQFIDAVSVAASAGACYIVSILALIAVVNFIAWIRKTAYVWALPTNLPRFRTDWLVPAAVAAGVILGKLLWLLPRQGPRPRPNPLGRPGPPAQACPGLGLSSL